MVHNWQVTDAWVSDTATSVLDLERLKDIAVNGVHAAGTRDD
jgi:hypothetical protein